jgi:acyl-CoA thioesterase FadM
MSEINPSPASLDNTASFEPVFVWERRVEFSETDAAGICHFSSFFIFMEQAEHAMFRSLGWSVFPSKLHRAVYPLTPPAASAADDSMIPSWPRVHCSCEFFSPARFEDVLSIEIGIERVGTKSIVYQHTIRCGERILARCKVITVCSHIDPETGRLTGWPIPPTIRAGLEKMRSNTKLAGES